MIMSRASTSRPRAAPRRPVRPGKCSSSKKSTALISWSAAGTKDECACRLPRQSERRGGAGGRGARPASVEVGAGDGALFDCLCHSAGLTGVAAIIIARGIRLAAVENQFHRRCSSFFSFHFLSAKLAIVCCAQNGFCKLFTLSSGHRHVHSASLMLPRKSVSCRQLDHVCHQTAAAPVSGFPLSHIEMQLR